MLNRPIGGSKASMALAKRARKTRSLAIFSTRAFFARASSEESPATASASKKIAMFIDDCSSGVVVHELKSETYSASVRDQSGLSTITWPGQGGKPNSASAPENSVRKRLQRRLVHGFGQDQAIVLIGADGLLAAALAAHHDQAGLVAHFGRAQQVEQFGEQAAVEVGDDFRDHLELHALAAQRPHLVGDLLGGRAELLRASRRDRCGRRPAANCRRRSSAG